MIGRTISHYRVLSVLGEGGMGIVYEAEDTRLGRHVALKLLPDNLPHDPTALQRLQREARTACRLNHPNICTIYEIEEQDGQPVIVMELLEGESLKVRLGGARPIPLPEALDLGIQMADALQAAHKLGIVHRDIKPANIFLTRQGSLKILDFGLAKLAAGAQFGDNGAAALDEKEESLTTVGAILGTAGYMSPEQARGEPLDTRTDIFSLGVVLCLMTAGEQPFQRKNRVLTLDAILNSQPKPPSHLNQALPVELDTIVAKALAKDREQRYQTAGELRDDLWRLKSTLASAQSSPFSYRGGAPARPAPDSDAVTVGDRAAPPSVVTSGPHLPNWKLIVPGTLVVVALAAAVVLSYSRRSTALTEKDDIVLADFDNKTGDPVFDETLKQGLAVDLGQSPFLNIISDQKMATTLRLMGRSLEQPAIGEVAREVCQRLGAKAMLAGSIAALGNNYVIGLNAINCATGDALFKQQVQVRGKEEVLKALGNSATEMRGKLGESLASVQKYDVPIEEATTTSLEALKAYSMGERAAWSGGDVAGIPYYQRALALDPNFAQAYRRLATAYSNLGQSARAIENAKKAFELRERVSEREKYDITARYYSIVTGEWEKAIQTYELYGQSYPRDWRAHLNLGDAYMMLGEYEKALSLTEAGLRLEPNTAVGWSNLGWVHLALNQAEQARKTTEQAQGHNIDSVFLRLVLYQAAFLRGDWETMGRQLTWAAGRSGEEDWLLSTQSDTEAYFGRLSKARELSRRAVDSAQRADAKETAALWQANAALREAEFGNTALARQNATAALVLASGRDVESVVALALAQAGDTVQAKKVADSLNQDFPRDTTVQQYWLPAIHSAIAIDQKNPTLGLQVLQTAAPYELRQCEPFQLGMMYPVYLRGQAYLLARQGKEAGAEFQKMIEHRGIVLNSPLGALAHLGLARAYALQAATEPSARDKARTVYQDFLTLWNNADPDIPIYREAKAEYAKLH
jgi:serine/threonine protein kinase/Flp pilus assembly protein TadD